MNNNYITLKSVRLSFPSLFKTAIFNGQDTKKYSATFLLSKKDVATKKLIDNTIQQMVVDAKIKIPSRNIFVQDGDEGDLEKNPEYENTWIIRSSTNRRPTIINRDKTPLTEEDEVLYAGCYVDAIISPWIQKNDFAKRVNCNLQGVRFIKDGEPFGAGNRDVTGLFEDLEDVASVGCDVDDL